MKISTIVLSMLTGIATAVTLYDYIGVLGVMVVSYLLGSLIGYFNETYKIKVERTRA